MITSEDAAIIASMPLYTGAVLIHAPDRRDYGTMLARESINAYNAFFNLGRQSPRALLFTEGLDNPGSLRMWYETTTAGKRPYWHAQVRS